MKRHVRFTEPRSGLSARCVLLDDKAPQSAEFLWQLAQTRPSYDAIHAMWTGPELSCPLPASILPEQFARADIPLENATSFPQTGEIVLAYVKSGSIKGLPPGPFFDVGIFYGDGGRLFFPFGWLMANICAEIVPEDLAHAQSCIGEIRKNGACRLSIEPVD